MNHINSKLIEWASQGSRAIDDYLDLTSPFLLEKPLLEPKHQWVLKHLSISCNLTSESTLLLISYANLWDAEGLLRSVIEGTFKYAFLCVGDTNELKSKVSEYLEELPELNQLKEHQRVESFLATVDNASADEWEPLRQILLPESEVDELRLKYPRIVARRLQQKWSFNEIAIELAKPDSGFGDFDSLRRLLTYNYGVSSHVMHQDADGVKLVWNRNKQEPTHRELTDLAHAARQLNDLLIMAMLRTAMTFKIHNADMSPVTNLFQSHKKHFDEWSESKQTWWDTQSQRP